MEKKYTPLISVALATYNGENFLAEQLESIFHQSHANIEVIACDDCSEDRTVQILEKYSKKYNLKYYVNEEKLGFVKNFEKAISLCNGEYIALADQDDIWLPEKLEILLYEIGNYSLICSDMSLINEKGEIYAQSLVKHVRRRIDSGNQFKSLIFHNFVTGCTTLFKRDLLEKALPFPEKTTFHDWWLAIVASKTNGIKFLHKPLVLYRQHSSNTTQLRTWTFFIKSFNIKKDIFQAVDFKNLHQIAQMLLTQKNIPLNNREVEILREAIDNYNLILSGLLKVKTIKFLIKRFGYPFFYKLFYPFVL